MFTQRIFMIGRSGAWAVIGIAMLMTTPVAAETNVIRLPSVESRVEQLEAEVACLRSQIMDLSACGSCEPECCDCDCGPIWRPGFYIGLSGGVQHRSTGIDLALNTAAEWKDGFGVSGMIGYRFPSNFRAEFETSLLDNDNIGFFTDYANLVREPSSGHVTLRSFMTNLYYDMPLDALSPCLSRIRPYFGVGIGVTESTINGVTSPTLSTGTPFFAPIVLDTASRYTYTWQARIGISYLMSDNAELFGGWRHFQTNDLRFNTPAFTGTPTGGFGLVQVTGANIDMLEVGLRIFF
jgi:opacity protein-like surface antigen